ncbi:MAG: hypothetical protein M1416_01515, partial [Candidatus Pacearchaeota archaeon]|nr:hypothetical protein [Candidatus Pacearchaeota archaeon]
MIEKKDILFGLTGLLFALSAIFAGISQNYEMDSTRNLISPIIEFEKSGYISNNQMEIWEISSLGLLDRNFEVIKNSMFCSIASFYVQLYKEQLSQGADTLKLMTDNCLKSPTDYNDFISNSLSMSKELKNISNSIKPMDSLSESFDKYYKNKEKARIWEWTSWGMFLLGFFIF